MHLCRVGQCRLAGSMRPGEHQPTHRRSLRDPPSTVHFSLLPPLFYAPIKGTQVMDIPEDRQQQSAAPTPMNSLQNPSMVNPGSSLAPRVATLSEEDESGANPASMLSKVRFHDLSSSRRYDLDRSVERIGTRAGGLEMKRAHADC